MNYLSNQAIKIMVLNESPSEKEGKFLNDVHELLGPFILNESPSEKEGKFIPTNADKPDLDILNESPSEKEGKSMLRATVELSGVSSSMKVPPKRKGNIIRGTMKPLERVPQ